MLNKNFIISSTPFLEGFKIDNYLGTVTSNVVTGTGLFSDILAGISDVFGGRSESYQKQLASIKNEVLEILKLDAESLGANGIVGLNMDFDEISGKGKSMFMVSALGTAVKISSIDGNNSQLYESNNLTRVIAEEDLYKSVQKEILLKRVGKGVVHLSEDDLNFIVKNKVGEVFDTILRIASNKVKDMLPITAKDEREYKYFVKYVNCLHDADLLNNIYKVFLLHSKAIADIALDLIAERQLLDFKQVEVLLNNKSFLPRYYALKIIDDCDKPYYSNEDIKHLEKIYVLIENNFPITGEVVEKKLLMSSKTVTQWICECGKKNDNTADYCYSCFRDPRGFKRNDIKPEDLFEYLSTQISVLKTIFNENKETQTQ